MRAFVLAFLTWLLIAGPLPQAGDLDPGYWESSPLPQIGVATYYAPGVMEWVRNYRRERGEITDCQDCVGAVALLRAGDIGRKVWLQPLGGELAGPFLVVDCARDTDIPALLDRNWVVDVGYELGQLWGMAGPLEDVIVWADPGEPATGPVRPAGRPLPAYIDPSQVVISPPTATPAASEPSLSQVSGLPTRLPRPLAQATPKPTLAKPVAGTPTITVPTPTPFGDDGSTDILPTTAATGATALPPARHPSPGEQPVPAAQATPAPTAQLPILAVLATASASQRATAQAPAAEAPAGDASSYGSPDEPATGASSVAIGRPGAELLARAVVLHRPTPSPTATRDPARPTSLPILPPGARGPSTAPSSTALPSTALPSAAGAGATAPGNSTPQPLSPLDQLWLTLLDLLGR